MIICFGAIFTPVTAFVSADDVYETPAKAAIAIDSDSGKILYAQNADKAMGIASITKIITAYLTLDAIKKGTLHWDDKVKMSDYAYELTQNPEASNIAVNDKDESFSIRDLFNATMIQSANSAAITLAEKVGGTEPKFVDMMKSQLAYWGITDAKLVNASGLNNSVLGKNIYPGSSETAENELSAKDVAIVAQHLIRDFPDTLATTKKATETFDKGGASEQTLATYNYMLPGLPAARAGVDGLKTGTTEFAGACFVATTMQNNFRIITVVLNADGADTDDYARFTATGGLMNYVYGTWTARIIANKDVKMSVPEAPTKLTVLDGQKTSVNVLPSDNFSTVVPMASDSKTSLSFSKKQGADVTAAITKHQKLVKVTFNIKDKLGYLPGSDGEKFYLTATSAVPRSNSVKVMWNHFVRFVNEKL
ncbi:D-alanyl-D-alanine carboxypeptidase [Lactococcus insecticola]|uniref:serine-type D-Ala-D-Ala carboxypeptidase n=1 Tax=Pseudolactococcus insecticola TaxID=2709158 RepID=A0A6A0B7L3_9LACT|nr:D-alanyl-D-alanine carboxypeptidase [Lactococcus insecticola]